MSSKPTIKEIAKLARVSIGTVDRVIHNRGEVSKDTRELIEGIMNDLEYVPNTYARNLVLNKIYKIAVLLPKHKKGEYWSAPLQGAQKAMNDYKSLGVKVQIYLYDQYKVKSFRKACKQVLLDGNHAVLMSRVLYDETNTFLADCKKKEVPYIITGTIRKNTNALVHIGQDSFQSGRLAGELCQLGQQSSVRYLVANITKAENPNDNVKYRIEGFKNFFSDMGYPNGAVSVFSIPQEEKELLQKLRAKISMFSSLGGIYVPNSKSFLLAKALQSKGDIRIVGYDLLDKNKELLVNGKIDFLINQCSDEQIYQGIELLYKFLSMNQKPPEIVSLPLDIVTKEKLMYY